MIFCYSENCVNWNSGFCTKAEITINEDNCCEEYTDYSDTVEYQCEFWRAIKHGEVHYKQKDKGRRGEENGIVFYYWDKKLEPESKIIEERTGYMAFFNDIQQPKRLEHVKKLLSEIAENDLQALRFHSAAEQACRRV